jgi:hypothetical protein
MSSLARRPRCAARSHGSPVFEGTQPCTVTLSRMKFQEIAARINSLGLLGGSIGWVPPELDVTRARQLISYLEDRRILFNPYGAENAEEGLRSVAMIRQWLTEALVHGPPGPELEAIVRGMRSACRKFMDAAERRSREVGYVRGNDPIFNQALGELRGEFGWLLGALAAKYGLDVEDQLATIIPEID